MQLLLKASKAATACVNAESYYLLEHSERQIKFNKRTYSLKDYKVIKIFR